MLTHYLKITLRTIRKEKFRYIITTMGISVGIVIFSFMLFFVDGMNRAWHKAPNESQLYSFIETSEEGFRMTFLDNITLYVLKDISMPEIENVAKINIHSEQMFICNSNDESKIFKTKTTNANPSFFDLSGMKFIKGAIDEESNLRDQIIITDKYAKLLFGKNDVIGNKVSAYSDKNEFKGTYTVAGVVKAMNHPDYNFDVIFPSNFEDAGSTSINTIVKLGKDDDIELVNASLKIYKIRKIGYSKDAEVDTYLQLVSYSNNDRNLPMAVQIGLLLIGGMVLAISLFNFVNLLISSMQSRVRQFTLRKIVGAQPWSFVAMIILEILPVIIASVLFSYFLLELLIHLFINDQVIAGINLADFISLIFRYPFKIGLWMLVSSIILAIIMSWRLRKIVLTQGIRGQFFRFSKNIGRNMLLFTEILLTLIFLNTALFLVMDAKNSISDTYQPISREQGRSLLYVPLNQLELISKSDEIVNRIKSIPGVIQVADNYFENHSYMDLRTTNLLLDININTIFDDYDKFWELEDTAFKRKLAPNEAIINRELADKLIEDNATSFKLNRQNEYNIVGVVDDIPYRDSNQYNVLVGTSPIGNLNNCIVKCSPNNKVKVEKEIVKIVREFLPNTVDYEIKNLYDESNTEIVIIESYSIIMLIASILSIIITVLGIYTSITYDTNKKRKEIAIRKINGASNKNILMYISKVYVIIILAAGVLASLLHRFLIIKTIKTSSIINFKYSIAYDAIILVILTLIIAAIVSIQIRRAMSENPSEVIKSE